MSDHSNDEKRKNIPDRNIQRMSKPNDESMGKRRPHTSEEEQLPEKIEKVTESLLSQWEISEDDFEDTQDLAETAAQLSDYEERPVRREGERRAERVRPSGNTEGRRLSEESGNRTGETRRVKSTGNHDSVQANGGRAKSVEGSNHGKSNDGRVKKNESLNRGSSNGERAKGTERLNRGTSNVERKETSESARSEIRRNPSEEGRMRKVYADRAPSSDRGPAGRKTVSENHNNDSIRNRQDSDDREKNRRPEKGDPRQDSRAPKHVSSERSHNTSRAQVTEREAQRRREASRVREEDAGRKAGERRSEAAAVRDNSRSGNSGRGSDSRKQTSRRKQANPIVEFWNSLHTMDKVVGFTGIFVCIFAIITFSILANAKATDKQVQAFASVGENLSQINVTDDSVFLAVADAHKAKQEAADVTDIDESEEYNEKDDNSDVQVGLNMTSVEKDLKIKFVNRKTGKLVPLVNFQVEIKGPDKTYTKDDDDKDGIIYLTGITPGKYTVRITGPENVDGYSLPSDAQEVTVKDHIEYKKIDVADEVKKESEVNAAKEDTQVKTQTESVLQDTVEWVESTKTPVGGSGNDGAYVEVKKADVPDPSASASLVFDKFYGVKSQKPWVMFEAVQPRDTTADGGGSNTTPGIDPKTEPSVEPTKPSEPENVAVTGVRVSQSSISGKVGDKVKLDAYVDPDNANNKKVSWETKNDSVATVNDGNVTFVGEGTTDIIVKTDEGGFTATASVSVQAKDVSVESVSISGESSVTVGSSITLSVNVSPDGAQYDGVKWSSSDSSIATVAGGTVTGVKAGEATITAEAGGKSGSQKITVKEAEVVLTSIAIKGEASGKKGSTIQLSITPNPANADASVTWKSSNEGVATIDANGKVTCKAAGDTTITAISKKDTGKTATLAFKVTEDVTKKFDMKDVSVTAGQFKNLEDYSTIQGSSSRSFSIENTKYATVDGNGRIKAIRAGETKITVTVKFQDGTTQTQTKKLTVTAASVKGITLDKTKVTLKVGDSIKLNPTIDTTGYTGCLWYTSDKNIVSLEEHGNGTIKALKPGKVTIIAKASEDTSKTATCEITVTGEDPKNDTKTPLKDKSGKQLYVKTADGKYVLAVVADYYKYNVFYRENENVEYKYTGWQTIDGKRYYFDKNGNKVTGDQVIQGVKYSFGSDGALSSGSGVLGIDVSKHNGNINWTEVKNSGVSFVIIRCGYRGSSTGALIEDPKFKANVQGATAAGLKVGIYFFTQAVNQIEAVEEASMTVSLIKNYKISYPVFLDVEASGGRADGLDTGTRTQIVNAYCQTIQNSGYTAGVYANKTWLNSKLNVGSLGGYKIWLAQYAAAPTYNGRYDMWQYSSTGKIGGISGNTDLNISYLGY